MDSNKRFIFFVFITSLSFFFINNYFFPEKVVKRQEQLAQVLKKEEDKPQTKLNYTPVHAEKGKYFVLENESIQLVFHSQGGVLSEINLPNSIKSPNSDIHKIELDHRLAQAAPSLNRFPMVKNYYTEGMQHNTSHEQGDYYPLIRRESVPFEAQAFAVSSDQVDLSKMEFEVTKLTKDSITLLGHSGSRKISKTFTLDPNSPYGFNVHIDVKGKHQDLFLSSGILEVEPNAGSGGNILKYRSSEGTNPEITTLTLPKEQSNYSTAQVDWISHSNGFFGMIIHPLQLSKAGLKVHKVPGNLAPSRITHIGKAQQQYPAESYPGYCLLVPVESSTDFRVYAGPYQKSLLSNFNQQHIADKADYDQAETYQGWFPSVSKPFSKFLNVILDMCYALTRSWGISIILLTIVLRILLYPLNSWAIRSSIKSSLIAPELEKIQTRYKNDPAKLNKEMLKLYKESGANPVTGCFAGIIQFPFLIGMFSLLRNKFELRGASFIPGWIDNLTEPDVIFSWGHHIPFLGTGLHLLPFIAAGMMFLQHKYATSSRDDSQMTDQQRQQSAFMNIFSLMYLFFAYNFPSGLNLYWVCSSILAIGQQYIANKYVKPKILAKNKFASK